MERISDELYKQILENMPIFAVDAIIFHEGKVLLAKRKQEPAKGEWWIPGGRVKKNEKAEDVIKRRIFEETGLKVEVDKRIGSYEVFFKECPFEGVDSGVHYISWVYLVRSVENQEVKLDETQSEYKWIDKIEDNLAPYVKKALEDSGVFSK